jgi:hypothetical protein
LKKNVKNGHANSHMAVTQMLAVMLKRRPLKLTPTKTKNNNG